MRYPSLIKIVSVSILVTVLIATAGCERRTEAYPAVAPALAPGHAQFCILMGLNDTEPAVWDGSISANGARITALDAWRLDGSDRLETESWQLSTRKVNLTRGSQNSPERHKVLPNGFYLTADLSASEASFSVETEQGDFSFTAKAAGFGNTLRFLDGRVTVERVPLTQALSSSIEEQDFPTLAESADKIYLAYVEFRHGDRSKVWPRQLTQKPASFAALERPAGGDQVMLMEYVKSTKTWTSARPVSARGQDVYRTAVAVDGGGRVWVFWSAQLHGNNFELFARYREGRTWSDEMRLTENPGPDLYPVAATDSEGGVWLAWQSYRDAFHIYVRRQQGDEFSPEERVSISNANDWSPEIAAGQDGWVAVAWDTYDKGDYDVYLRRLRYDGSIGADKAIPVAASHKFEVRPSIAFDSQSRIWAAYEEGFAGWGKDFGAYETSGTGLYQGHTVRVKVLEGDKHWTSADPLAPLFERRAESHPWNKNPGRPDWDKIPFVPQPDPRLGTNRPLGITGYPRVYSAVSHPRLRATPQGTIALAYRNVSGNIWGPLGTTWFENVAFHDGKSWTGPVFVPHSDGILDQRPVFAAISDATLLMVGVTDHRFVHSGTGGSELAARAPDLEGGLSPKYNYDLMSYELPLPGPAGKTELSAMTVEAPAKRMDDVRPEQRQVDQMRRHRITLKREGGEEKLSLLRGEFHRHTAVSSDGANDGDLVDAWRYMMDAAYMDWFGCCDHDNGNGREYTWWLTQKMTDAFNIEGKFVSTFSHERSVRYPEGHRNVIMSKRGVRPLPRLPKTADDSPARPAPDTQMLYEYLRYFDGITAVHTSGTNMGTDWRDNDPVVEPVVEIYQGDRQNYEIPEGPRANTEDDSIGGWRPLGFVSHALARGYRLGFQASSDHVSTHMSYCNLWVREPTRDGVLEAFKKRRIYGATDNILADVRCDGHFMGEEFSLTEAPQIDVELVGMAPFAKVQIIKDGVYAYSVEPGAREVSFSWRDNAAEKGKTSYYYVRGEQTDGEIVWVSPMWITLE